MNDVVSNRHDVDDEFRDYYRSALQAGIGFDERTRATFTVAWEGLAQASARPGSVPRLREDAAYMLQLNAVNMVLAPLAANAGDRDVPAVLRGLSRDLQTIIRAAGQLTDGREITGHAIIDATSQTWSELSAMLPAVWG